MSVTVIATGFVGGDGEKPKAGSLDVDMDLDDEDFIGSTPAVSASSSAPTRSTRSVERVTEPRVDPAVIDDDDTFTDIMSIFNRK